MPIVTSTVIGVIALVIAVAVWTKTRRPGPVLSVAFTAMVVLAITDPTFIQTGANAVGQALTWFTTKILNWS